MTIMLKNNDNIKELEKTLRSYLEHMNNGVHKIKVCIVEATLLTVRFLEDFICEIAEKLWVSINLNEAKNELELVFANN